MIGSIERFSQIQPRLMRCDNGEWLAVSEVGAPLNIGVVAPTPDGARGRFARSLEAWVALLKEVAYKESNNGGFVGT